VAPCCGSVNIRRSMVGHYRAGGQPGPARRRARLNYPLSVNRARTPWVAATSSYYQRSATYGATISA
jgi:hypothetical protein